MRKKFHLHRHTHQIARRWDVLVPALAVLIIGAGAIWFALDARTSSTSPEAKFTDASRSGLAIVPASGASAPPIIIPPVTGGCETDWLIWLGICVAAPVTPSGGGGGGGGGGGAGGGGGGCPSGDSCTASIPIGSCPVGYSFDGIECVFAGCPSGYAQTTSGGEPACIVYCTPRNLCGSGGNLYYEDSGCNISAGPIQLCPYGCTGVACNPPPAPKVVSFTVHPTLVEPAATTDVNWEVQNVTACQVSGTDGDSWSGDSGAKVSSPITGQTTFTLTCSIIPGAVNADGSPASPVDLSATVNVVPKFKEN